MSVPPVAHTTDVAPATSQDQIDEIISLINAVFTNSPLKIFTELLRETRDINATHDGWSLLQFAVYLWSHTNDRSELFELIEKVVENGGNLENLDSHNRSCVYFLSTYEEEKEEEDELDDRLWNLFNPLEAHVNPQNPTVSPLHVLSANGYKYAISHLIAGANPLALDKYQRTPLHVAAAMTVFDEDFCNVKALVYFNEAPLSMKDQFGKAPLFYAALFGENPLYLFLLERSPPAIVEEVMEQINELDWPDEGADAVETNELLEEFERKMMQEYHINDEIYSVPYPLKINLGEAPSKKRAKKLLLQQGAEALEKRKTTLTHEVNTYHDGHGYKHCMKQNDYDKCYGNNRAFAESTRDSEAMFLPEVINNQSYDDFFRTCIESWAQKGRDKDLPYVTFTTNIGAELGHMTKSVQICFTENDKAHVRPKFL